MSFAPPRIGFQRGVRVVRWGSRFAPPRIFASLWLRGAVANGQGKARACGARSYGLLDDGRVRS